MTAHARGFILRVVGAFIALTFLAFSNLAQAQISTNKFDHLKTGFALTGEHSTARCESCHINGVFKGTPKDCASCHVSGLRLARGNVVKPQQHIPTQMGCETCHSTKTFSGAKFSHAGVATGSCSTCHNGGAAPGKPSGHVPTQASCDTCHKTAGWLPASNIDHSSFTSATNCSSCHNGSGATGKAATHIPTTANCVSCHTVAGWKPTKWNHTQTTVVNQCSSCHSGSYPPADGLTPNHIPYKSVTGIAGSNCDTCHKGGFANWSTGGFHKNVSVSTQCSTCHLGSGYGLTSKPATAIHASVTGNCESCHKTTTSWAASNVDHSTFTTATNCSTCHNGSTATGKTATHINTTANCTTCHKSGYTTWLPARFHVNVAVATGCASCHNGTMATGKSSGHVATTAACETCHSSNTSWTGAKVNHSTFTVATNCGTCHNGTTATGKTSNHIPTSAFCSTCHKSGYTTWSPGRFHINVAVVTGCATCHATAAYGLTAKPGNSTHTNASVCETCHKSSSNWLSVQYTHAAANAIGTGTCDTCHNGSTSALSKPATHIPVPAGIAKCDSCHRSQVSFNTSVTMNHSSVSTATCKSCHNGSYTSQGNTGGAMAKVANHVPEAQLLNGAAMDCVACHSSTASWTTQRMNHNASLGNGAGWCKACHASGTNFLGNMEKKSLTHEAPGKTDCSTSGCHRPLGNTGQAYSKWN